MPIIALIIVVAIAAFIFLKDTDATLTPNQTPDQAKTSIQKVDLETKEMAIRQSLNVYKATHGDYPESLDDLPDMPNLPENVDVEYNNADGSVSLFVVD